MCLRTSIPIDDDMLVMFSDSERTKTGIVIWKKPVDSEKKAYLTGIKFIRDDIDDSGV
jgi:hypothetical protein